MIPKKKGENIAPSVPLVLSKRLLGAYRGLNKPNPIGFPFAPPKMAKRIAVSGSKEHLKKSVALLLIRRGMAYWVEPGSVIARREAKTAVCVDIRFELRAAPEPPRYIPETLPMAEIPGIRFVPPAGTPKRRLLAIPPAEMYASL